jgi:hypothetical protein
MKWKIKENSRCDVCNMEQTILHLLFDCIYVKRLWEKVSSALGWTVEQHTILYGSKSESFKFDNIMISVVCFLIYKEWLVCSLESKNRPRLLCYQTFIGELDLRKCIYEQCKMQTNVNAIEKLVEHLYVT